MEQFEVTYKKDGKQLTTIIEVTEIEMGNQGSVMDHYIDFGNAILSLEADEIIDVTPCAWNDEDDWDDDFEE